MTRLADSAYPHRLPAFFLSLMLPRKGQPFPPERRNCSHTFRGVLQFRLPSAPQRYNTLDFPTENRVPTGMLLAPIGNPEPKRGYPSLKSPRPFRIPDQASNTQSPQHRSMYFSGAILCEREIQIAHISTHSCSKVRCCCRSETK